MSQRVFSFHYTLTDSTGEILDKSDGQTAFAFIEGASQIIPGLERQIVLLKKGDKNRIQVGAAEAYGLRDEALVVEVGRDKIPSESVAVGDQFRGGDDDHSPIFTAVKVTAETVTLDGNHPLAGKDLAFDVELVDIRPATQEELDHGHIHGPGAHSH